MTFDHALMHFNTDNGKSHAWYVTSATKIRVFIIKNLIANYCMENNFPRKIFD